MADSLINIKTSRESIRSQFCDYLKNYLDLESIDLYKTSFLSYLIDILSVQASNQLFYTSTLYKEFFLNLAQLPESVHNLVKWIGYDIQTAVPATASVMFTIPMRFPKEQCRIIIPKDYRVFSGDIPFTIDAPVIIETINNTTMTVFDSRGGYYHPSLISEDKTTASFLLPFTQIDRKVVTFTIPTDLEFYQFFTKTFTDFKGQVSDVEVYVFPPTHVSEDAGSELLGVSTVDEFDEFLSTTRLSAQPYMWTKSLQSVHLLSSVAQEYVWSTIENQATILFGNGIIGKQPVAGSYVAMVLDVTKGSEGNVIEGSISNGDAINFNVVGETRKYNIQKQIINPAAASGGVDTPSLSEIKTNALVNLRSKERLVSEGDYDDIETIFSNTPLVKCKPILKRSDLKANEIDLFSLLTYTVTRDGERVDEIVHTRNLEFDTFSTYIPRGTEVPGYEDFITAFNITVDPDTKNATYNYLLTDLDVTPVFQWSSTDNDKYFMSLINVNFMTLDTTSLQMTVSVNHTPNEYSDIEIFGLSCSADGNEYILDPDIEETDDGDRYNAFQTVIPISEISEDTDSFTFTLNGTLEDPENPGSYITKDLQQYTCPAIIRRSLNDFMRSSVFVNIDGSYTVQNVPCFSKSYIMDDQLDHKDFELNVLQRLLFNININSKRMLTDFINLKFADSFGDLTNMHLNETAEGIEILPIELESIPVDSTDLQHLDAYIIQGNEGPEWKAKRNQIAIWNESLSQWIYVTPTYDMTVKVYNNRNEFDPENNTVRVFNGSQWIKPTYTIPLQIALRINVSPTYSGSKSSLVESVRTTLVDYFAPKFGLDVSIDRSEIVKVVRGVEGVEYCTIESPETDIRFTYDLENMTPLQLFSYTPQLVTFSEEDISITVSF